MKNLISLISSSLLFLIPVSILAEEVPEPEQAWKASVQFGYVATSGNTKTTSINGGFSASYEEKQWEHSLDIKTIFGSAEDATTSQVETNAEKYFIEGKSDYKFSDKGYAFVVANYEDDRFSDNDYQASMAVGRGFKFITSKTSKLGLELGVGYRETKKSATLTLPEESIGETIARLAGKYVWKITKTSNFEQKLSAEIGDENTVTKSYTGLSANIAENLALKLSLTATHQSEVRAGAEELDTVTAVTVVYSF
jgi:putative salt-induced outer membrane protein